MNSVNRAAFIYFFLLFINIAASLIKSRWKTMEKLMEGVPTIIVEHGRLMQDRMRTARVSRDDVMEAARRMHGIERRHHHTKEALWSTIGELLDSFPAEEGRNYLRNSGYEPV